MCKMIIGISWNRYCIFAVGKFCLFKNNNKKGYNYLLQGDFPAKETSKEISKKK